MSAPQPTFMSRMTALTPEAPTRSPNEILLKDCRKFIEDVKELMDSAKLSSTTYSSDGFPEDIARAESLIEWIDQTIGGRK